MGEFGHQIARMASLLLRSARVVAGSSRAMCTTPAAAKAGGIPGEAAVTEHAIEATAQWKRYSKMFGAVVAGVGVINMFMMLSGHHHEDVTLYPFRRMRTKPFPWGDGQHSLFGHPAIDDAE